MHASPKYLPQYTFADYASWQGDWELETDWIVADDTVVRPDIAIVCGSFPERHIVEPPRLIVEVLSASTEEKDRTAKRDQYASQTVECYLLVDPIGKRIEAFQRDSANGGFHSLRSKSGQDLWEFELGANCVAKLDAASLFRF